MRGLRVGAFGVMGVRGVRSEPLRHVRAVGAGLLGSEWGCGGSAARVWARGGGVWDGGGREGVVGRRTRTLAVHRARRSGGRGRLGCEWGWGCAGASGRAACGTGTFFPPPPRTDARGAGRSPPPRAALTGRARRAAPRFVSVPAASGIRRAAAVAAAAPPWHPGPRAAPPPPGRRRRRRARRPPAGCGAPRCPLQAPRGGRAEAGAGGTRPAAPRRGRAGGSAAAGRGSPPPSSVPAPLRGAGPGRALLRRERSRGWGGRQTAGPPGVGPSLQVSSIPACASLHP